MDILAIAVVFLILAYFLVRPCMLYWGAAEEEIEQTLPGDELIAHPLLSTTRALAIRANVARVWPWLVQIGQGRGGFYSYAWLENIAGLDIHNTDRIVPEWQNLKVGDLIPFRRGAGINVVEIRPERLLALAGTLNPIKKQAAPGAGQIGGTWTFALSATGADTCRLIVRSQVASFPPLWLSYPLMQLLLLPMHFIMERKMMLGIRRRAETMT